MIPSSSSVFKAYDIRGLAPGELDAEFALGFAQALAARYQPKRVLVGRDMRLTSPELESALIEGLVGCGVDVVRIGLCSTPMFNVLIHLEKGGYDLGVMVTASHNPGEYNGFKITLGDGLPVGMGSGMEELRDAYDEKKTLSADARGVVTDDVKALETYVTHIIGLANMPADMPEMKIAIDAGNGMAGAVLPVLLAKLPWLKTENLYFTPDGSFPNHEANPLKTQTLQKLSATVLSEGCLFGVAFDGDADRIGFTDEQGQPIPGDILTAFIGQELVTAEPGGLIHYDVRSSWAVAEAIAAVGGTSSMCRVGHAYIKQLMRESGAIFAGELSMHFYFRELGNFESGDYTLLLMLRRLAREQKSLSKLVAPLMTYVKSEETNFTVTDPQAKIAELQAAFVQHGPALVSELDGIRLEFRDAAKPVEDWWFSARASNTEPLLRLNVEAKTMEALAKRMEELKRYLL